MSKTAAEMSAETVARRPKTGTQQRREKEARAAEGTPQPSSVKAVYTITGTKPVSLDAEPNTTTTTKETAMPTTKSTRTAVVAKQPAKAPAVVTPPAPAVVAPADMELVYTPTSRSLKTLEGVIQKGLDSYVKAGHALREINERKLFTEATDPETGEKFTSFETYVKARWDMTKQRAHQIIDAAKTVAVLVTFGAKYLPAGEFATRQIADVAKSDPATAVAIVNTAGDASPTGKVTAKALAETRATVAPQRATAGGSGGSSTTKSVTFKGSGVARKASPLSTGSTTVVAQPRSDADRNKTADLKNLNDLMVALREGMLDVKDDDIRARVQRVAGLAITWLAGEWEGKPGRAQPLIISVPTAKVIAGRLLEQQATARQAREAAEAEALEKNKATVAASQAAQAKAAPAPVVVEAAPVEEPKSEQQLSDEEWAMAVLRDPKAGAVHQRIAREILGMPATGGALNMAATAPEEEETEDDDEADEDAEEEVEETEDEADDEEEVEDDEAEDEDEEDDEDSDEEDDEEFDFDLEPEAPAAPAKPAGRQVAARRR